MASEINKRTVLVAGPGGGVLDVVSSDGEVLYQLTVPPGQHRAGQYLALVCEGGELQVSSGIAAVTPASGVGVQRPAVVCLPDGTICDHKYQTGANPDFQPMGTAEKQAEAMRRQVARMTALNDTHERRLRAMAQVERIPDAPEAVEVVEPVETPEVPANAE